MRRNAYFLLAAVAIAAMAGAAGYRYYTAHKADAGQQVRNELAAIADLKVKQLQVWRAERVGNGRILAASGNIPAVRQTLAGSATPAAREQALEWMRAIVAASGYANAILVDSSGTVRLSTPPVEGSPSHYKALLERAVANGISFSDLHYDEGLKGAHLGLAIPLGPGAERRLDGALLLGIDPNRFLFPLLRSWPRPSRSAETVLVRRDGDEVLFLSELKYRPQAAATFRLPLARRDSVAVQAALGRQGLVDGIDYRGMPVLACVRDVPGSPWILISKMDADEVYAPVRREARWLALVLSSLLRRDSSASLRRFSASNALVSCPRGRRCCRAGLARSRIPPLPEKEIQAGGGKRARGHPDRDRRTHPVRQSGGPGGIRRTVAR